MSILTGLNDCYELSTEEYCLIYSFYVTYPLINSSNKKREISFYGWNGSFSNSGLKFKLDNFFNLDRNSSVKFVKKEDRDKYFQQFNLIGKHNFSIEEEYGVIINEKKVVKFFCLLTHIRNCLSHGNFALLYNSANIKMVVFEDKIPQNNYITARFILKLSTLFEWIKIIDINNHYINIYPKDGAL